MNKFSKPTTVTNLKPWLVDPYNIFAKVTLLSEYIQWITSELYNEEQALKQQKSMMVCLL